MTGDKAAVKSELREVLSKARGPEGAVLRGNAKRMAVELSDERANRNAAVTKQLAQM